MTSNTMAAWLRAQSALQGSPPPLDLAALPANPFALFTTWIHEAVDAATPEPRAATLSTVDASGIPDARVLTLKDVDARGWAVASTRSSAKGSQLAANPVAALSFWWQPVMRAVRVRGSVHEASAEESAADLAARPADARATVAPGDWVLWRIEPQSVEFWQGSPDRRHTRIMYERAGHSWKLWHTTGETKPVA